MILWFVIISNNNNKNKNVLCEPITWHVTFSPPDPESSMPGLACRHCVTSLTSCRDLRVAFILATSSQPLFSGCPGSHPWVNTSTDCGESLPSILSMNFEMAVGPTPLRVSSSSNIVIVCWISSSIVSQPFRLLIRDAALVFEAFAPGALVAFLNCCWESPVLLTALDLDFLEDGPPSVSSSICFGLLPPLEVEAEGILVSHMSSSMDIPSSVEPQDIHERLTLPASSAVMLFTLIRSWHFDQTSAISSSSSPACSVATWAVAGRHWTEETFFERLWLVKRWMLFQFNQAQIFLSHQVLLPKRNCTL